MTIEIEKGVPLPSTKPGRPPTYPLATMDIGDSFVVPREKAGSVRAAVSQQQRKPGKRRFETRMIGDRLRVWRIA